MNITHLPPLALYIHFPWCIKKCPYCDFNSHAMGAAPLPEKEYIGALLTNLDQQLPQIHGRPIISIFMGGGTPSLFSAESIDELLQNIKARCILSNSIEITLEANPGTIEQQRFKQYREVGINRISLGAQSFNDKQLKILGRIHNKEETLSALATIKNAGFTNFNIDIMFGLPQQTQEEGLEDLSIAILQNPSHISWYELTLEPNTHFWHHPPALPNEECIIDLHQKGKKLLRSHGFTQYEVSAYSRNQPCLHNLNYWTFGDYLAIGAGSHGKITDHHQQRVMRLQHFRHPKQFMDIQRGFIQKSAFISPELLAFEFMLNTLRLKKGVPTTVFTERTGLSLEFIRPHLVQAKKQGWLKSFEKVICPTPLGYRFLNNLVSLFLPNETHETNEIQ